MLGDLITVLANGKVITSAEKNDYINFTKDVNELSHASGIPTEINNVKSLSNWLQNKINEFSDIVDNSDKIDWETFNSKPSPKEYIDENFHSWNFKSIIDTVIKTHNGKCSFKIERKPTFLDFDALFDSKGVFLCNDGAFREIDQADTECLTLYSREETVELIKAINDNIARRCYDEGYEAESAWIYANIAHELKRTGIPTHLFTKAEIRELMANADDSQYNQLVIYEDGYAHLNNEARNGSLYPVSQEGWCAGNSYVGADSSLSDAEPSYRLCLEG